MLDGVYGAALAGLSPAIAWKWMRHGKYRESLPGMFGRGLAAQAEGWPGGALWVHAVSVGEVGAAQAVLPELRAAFPGRPVLVTTVTETGQAAARRQLSALADRIAYWPADFSPVVARFFDAWRPAVLLLMETELWPNVLEEARRRGVPVFAVNSKISARSFPKYKRLGWLLGAGLRSVSGWCVQTEADAMRVAALTGREWPGAGGTHEEGAGPIMVTGNVKFDLKLAPPDPDVIEEMRGKLGLGAGDRVVVIGSTHRGEEALLLQSLGAVMESRPGNVVVAVVPRHPERFEEAWEVLRTQAWHARRYSSGDVIGSQGRPRAVLVDAMGLLVGLYSLCDVAVVAGSFVPGIGGHNILEPAVFAKPVVFGPDMKGQPEMAQCLLEAGGGVQCGAEDVGRAVAVILDDEETKRHLGERGFRAVELNRGAARRSVDYVVARLKALDSPLIIAAGLVP